MRKFSAPVIDVKKYGRKQVVIVRGGIVASGATAKEALEEVRRKLPASTWRDILLVSVPAGITVVYRL